MATAGDALCCVLGVLLQTIVQKFTILESQLAWLVYIMGSIVGYHISCNSSGDAEKMDGEITASLFQVWDILQFPKKNNAGHKYTLVNVFFLFASSVLFICWCKYYTFLLLLVPAC